MLTIADGGGRGVQEPLILADVICEQPLIVIAFAIGPHVPNSYAVVTLFDSGWFLWILMISHYKSMVDCPKLVPVMLQSDQ